MDLSTKPRAPSIPRRRLRNVAGAASVYAILVSGLTLLGWATDHMRLADWWGSGVTQKPNTAIAAMLIGSAMLLVLQGRWLWPARLAALSAATIGALTLFEHFTRIDLTWFDTLLFDEPAGVTGASSPGRMGPLAAGSLVLLGLGLGLLLSTLPYNGRRAAQVLAVVTLTLMGAPLLGYLYGASFLYTIPRLTGIAFPTTTVLLALAIGLMAMVPEFGLIGVLGRRDSGGFLLRRLLLPIVLLPIALGYLRVKGEAVGLYDEALGTAMLVFVLSAALTTLLVLTARRLGDTSEALRRSEAIYRRLAESNLVGVGFGDSRGNVSYVNDEMLRMMGQSHAAGFSAHLTKRVNLEQLEVTIQRLLRPSAI